MSLPNCLPDLLASGKIRKGDAAAAERAYNAHYRRLSASMSPDAAAAEASARALAEIDYVNDLRGRRTFLAIEAQRRMDGEIAAHVAGGGGNAFGALTRMLRGVETATDRIQFQAHAALREFVEKHRRNMTGGNRDGAGMRDVIAERHGRTTGNANAKAFSDAIGQVFDGLVRRFNRAGGDVGYRADFGVPHAHDQLRVRKTPYPIWRDDIVNAIDTARMVDPLSGQAFTPERLEEFLAASYQNIRTGGLTGDGHGAAAGMLANRRSDHRFFVFRDGEAWLRYNEKYGTGSPYDAILGHVSGLSRDIALMERFGPNPAASWRRGMDRAAAADAAGALELAGSVKGTSFSAYQAEQMWRYMNGDFSVPVLADGPIAGPLHRGALGAVHGARDVITAAFLGSAQLTAISDINTQAFARKMNDLPAMRAATGYLEQLNPFSHADRQEAIRLGLGMRDATRAMLGIARFMGESNGPRWSQIIADDVLRLSGINKFTEAGQRMFGKDYLGRLAAERDMAFDALSPARRAAFERNGISPADWEVMRAAEPHKSGDGTHYMDWLAVAKRDQGVSDRMMDMILNETRGAVIAASAETAAITKWGRPGTLRGEIGANIFQFKSFPLALLMEQSRQVRDVGRRFGPRNAAAYAAAFFIGMTAFGAIAQQLREIAKGRDMRPMDNLEFWIDSGFQGGGAGIFGDVVGSFSNDRLNSIYQLLGGPMVGLAEDTKSMTGGFTPSDAQAERGEPANPGRGVSRFLRRYTPGTSLWWARAALDRMVFDQVQAQIDPDYWNSWQRMERRAEEQGQGEWWERGEMLPSRLPEMGETPQ